MKAKFLSAFMAMVMLIVTLSHATATASSIDSIMGLHTITTGNDWVELRWNKQDEAKAWDYDDEGTNNKWLNTGHRGHAVYHIDRSDSPTGPWQYIGSSNSLTFTHKGADVIGGKTYYYRLSAYINGVKRSMPLEVTPVSEYIVTFRYAKHGEVIGNLPEPTREGYAFNGWWSTSTGTKLSADTVVTANMTVLASWLPIFTLGRIVDNAQSPSTSDALEILKFIVGLDGAIKQGGEGSRALLASLITAESQRNGKPSTADALEILKKIVGLPNLIDG